MRRLYSSFAHGAPGAGLLLIRLAASTGFGLHAAGALASSIAPASTGLSLLMLATALLLVVGFWTPVAGALAVIAAGWHGVSNPLDLNFDILLGVLGIALALLGPGAWSVDARLFGWKRLEIQNGIACDSTSGSSREKSSST